METYAQDMNNALQKYGHCLLPNVGVLYFTAKPAYRSYQDNQVYPPSKEVSLLPLSNQSNKFYSIISEIAFSNSLSTEEATRQWEITLTSIKEKLSTGSSISLPGIGLLNLDDDNQITLSTEQTSFSVYQPVPTDIIKSFSISKSANPPEQPSSENINQAESKQSFPRFLNPGKKSKRKREMAIWWITLTIVALLAVGWLAYWGTMKRKEKEKTFKQIIAKDTSSHPAKLDSIALKEDSVNQKNLTLKDSIHYTVVFAVFDNQEKALRQFHKMKGWGHPVVLINKGPKIYELGMPFTTLPSDTTVSLVSMMKLYGEKVHIEYDSSTVK